MSISFIVGVPKENHCPAASSWQTLLHNIKWVHLAMIEIRPYILVIICTDCTGSCKSNYHTIMTMTNICIYNCDQYIFCISSCLHGGLCRSTDGVCLCPDGYTGPQCELNVSNQNIKHHPFKYPDHGHIIHCHMISDCISMYYLNKGS